MVIETDRLILRAMTEDDFDALYAVLADPDIMEHYAYTFDEDRVRGWIRKNIERYKVFGFGLWAVVLKEAGKMIGDCGLTMQTHMPIYRTTTKNENGASWRNRLVSCDFILIRQVHLQGR